MGHIHCLSRTQVCLTRKTLPKKTLGEAYAGASLTSHIGTANAGLFEPYATCLHKKELAPAYAKRPYDVWRPHSLMTEVLKSLPEVLGCLPPP